jgi:hypothetical protein
MPFRNEYGTILSPFVENYRAAKTDKDKKSIVKNAADAVLASKNELEREGKPLPKDLQTVCNSLIYSTF